MPAAGVKTSNINANPGPGPFEVLAFADLCVLLRCLSVGAWRAAAASTRLLSRKAFSKGLTQTDFVWLEADSLHHDARCIAAMLGASPPIVAKRLRHAPSRFVSGTCDTTCTCCATRESTLPSSAKNGLEPTCGRFAEVREAIRGSHRQGAHSLPMSCHPPHDVMTSWRRLRSRLTWRASHTSRKGP